MAVDFDCNRSENGLYCVHSSHIPEMMTMQQGLITTKFIVQLLSTALDNTLWPIVTELVHLTESLPFQRYYTMITHAVRYCVLISLRLTLSWQLV